MMRLNNKGPKIEQFLKNPLNMYRNKLLIAEIAPASNTISKSIGGTVVISRCLQDRMLSALMKNSRLA